MLYVVKRMLHQCLAHRSDDNIRLFPQVWFAEWWNVMVNDFTEHLARTECPNSQFVMISFNNIMNKIFMF